MIGLITPDTKQTGKRSAGNPHAAFDVAGVGNVTMVCRTAVHRESDGITTDAYRARACSRPYLRGAGAATPRPTHPYIRLKKEFVYLAVVLDAFSRKVVGWALDRTLAARLPIAALEQAVAQRQPPPGLVHHSDRGVQYACGDYAQVLQRHQMIPSMSRPANPYDNASCESFMKTFKREEIYANEYRDLDHLFANIEAFIEPYYNRRRLHSALGYRPPEEFERDASPAIHSAGATMSFFRHGEIYQSDEESESSGERPNSRPPAHRPDESPTGYSSASCSPAELASASPVRCHPEEEGAV
jgi:hypothetical protein